MPADDTEASREAVLRLFAEDLNIERSVARGDTVHVSTVTTTSNRLVEEMLRHETADVTRVPIGQEIDVIPDVWQQGDLTIVPVVKEILVLRKQLVLVEEIHIRRVSTEEPFVANVTLREQHAEITRTPRVEPTNDPSSTKRTEPMAESTIVAVYKTAATAEAAVRELEMSHVPADAISRHSNAGSYRGATRTAPEEERGFWASIFGSDDHADHSRYDRQVKDGNCVVTVRTPDDKVTHISAILDRHDPVDIDTENEAGLKPTLEAGARTPSAAGTTATRPAEGTVDGNVGDRDQTMQLSEERVAVGKRSITDGTTRVRRYVTETPVEKTIGLHSEKVTLDRQPVTDGKVVENPDFSEKSFSMTESHEEAVVAKDARVVEEVRLRKEGSDHDHTVNETVRKHEVEIDKGDGTRVPADDRRPAADRKI